MKTKIKMLIVAMIFTLSMVGCKKDYPIPDPPSPPKPEMTISVSDLSLMVGMQGEVVVTNVKDVVFEASKEDVILASYKDGKIIIEGKNPGYTILKIIDKADKKRYLKVNITVTPIQFGLMDAKGVMVLEGHYRFQGPKNLHLAPNGTVRKEHYLRIPMKKELQVGNIVSVEYKTPGAEQTLQAKIFLIKNQTIYAIMTDGGYLIFEKK